MVGPIQPPAAKPGLPTYFDKNQGPRRFELSITASQLGNVDTRTETCSLKLFIDVWFPSTKEEHVASPAPPLDIMDKFQMNNAVSLDKHEVYREFTLDPDTLKWHCVVLVIGVFQIKLDLHYFPFDCQQLRFTMEMGDTREMVYVPRDSATDFFTLERDMCQLTGWKVMGAGICFGGSDVSLSKSGKSYARATIYVSLARNWVPYVYRVMLFSLMMQLSVLLLWSYNAFIPAGSGLEPEYSNRVDLAFVIVLTHQVFQGQIHSELPHVSYCTLLEFYTLQAMFICFFVIFSMGIVHVAQRYVRRVEGAGSPYAAGGKEHGEFFGSNVSFQLIDDVLFYITVAEFLVAHVGLIIYAMIKRRESQVRVSCKHAPKTSASKNLKFGHEHKTKVKNSNHDVYGIAFDDASNLYI